MSVLPHLITLANFRSYPLYMDPRSILFLNVLIIVPIETTGLILVSRRILGQRLKLVQFLGLALVANLVTAVLGYPFVAFQGISGYPPLWWLLFYVLSSFIEGSVYFAFLRRREIRFKQALHLAFVVNLFSYVPTMLLTL